MPDETSKNLMDLSCICMTRETYPRKAACSDFSHLDTLEACTMHGANGLTLHGFVVEAEFRQTRDIHEPLQ